jgi:uncharacterized protein YoaH (UPF0181 family)
MLAGGEGPVRGDEGREQVTAWVERERAELMAQGMSRHEATLAIIERAKRERGG